MVAAGDLKKLTALQIVMGGHRQPTVSVSL